MKKIIFLIIMAVLTIACAPQPSYEVIFSSTEGNTASGKITIIQQKEGIVFQGTIVGLSPGEHGFHIHEKGDCSSPDAKSAGGHFNPKQSEHGALNTEQSHTGDLGNIMADEQGVAKVNIYSTKASVTGEQSIAGLAMIVHDKPDNYGQPTGNAGSRLACGIIK